MNQPREAKTQGRGNPTSHLWHPLQGHGGYWLMACQPNGIGYPETRLNWRDTPKTDYPSLALTWNRQCPECFPHPILELTNSAN